MSSVIFMRMKLVGPQNVTFALNINGMLQGHRISALWTKFFNWALILCLCKESFILRAEVLFVELFHVKGNKPIQIDELNCGMLTLKLISLMFAKY